MGDVYGKALDLLWSVIDTGLAHATHRSASDMVQRDTVSMFAGRPTGGQLLCHAPSGLLALIHSHAMDESSAFA